MILFLLTLAHGGDLRHIDRCADGNATACARARRAELPTALDEALATQACHAGDLERCREAAAFDIDDDRRAHRRARCLEEQDRPSCLLLDGDNTAEIDVMVASCKAGLERACTRLRRMLGLPEGTPWSFLPHPDVRTGDRIYLEDAALQVWRLEDLEVRGHPRCGDKRGAMWSPASATWFTGDSVLCSRLTGEPADGSLPDGHRPLAYAAAADRLLVDAGALGVRVWEGGVDVTPEAWPADDMHVATWADAAGTSVLALRSDGSRLWLNEQGAHPLRGAESSRAATLGHDLLLLSSDGRSTLYDGQGTLLPWWNDTRRHNISRTTNAHGHLLAPDDSWLATTVSGGVMIVALTDDAVLPSEVVRHRPDPVVARRRVRVREPGLTVQLVDLHNRELFRAEGTDVRLPQMDLTHTRIRAWSDTLDSGFVPPTGDYVQNLSVSPVAPLEVTVVDDQGVPVPDAMVWGARLGWGRTDAEGRVTLRFWRDGHAVAAVDRAGRYGLLFTDGASATTITIAHDVQSREIDAQVVRMANHDGTPRTDLAASAFPWFPVRPWPTGDLAITLGRGVFVQDERGNAVLPQPTPEEPWGTLRLDPAQAGSVLLRHADGRMLHPDREELQLPIGLWTATRVSDAGIETATIQIDEYAEHDATWKPAESRQLHGRVVDADGWPVPHATVHGWSQILTPEGDLHAVGPLTTEADAAGRYTLEHLGAGRTLVRADNGTMGAIAWDSDATTLALTVPMWPSVGILRTSHTPEGMVVKHPLQSDFADVFEKGDRILSVDGVPTGAWLDHAPRIRAMLFEITDEPTVVLVRDGEEITLRLTPPN